jgi:hypothetical protein
VFGGFRQETIQVLPMYGSTCDADAGAGGAGGSQTADWGIAFALAGAAAVGGGAADTVLDAFPIAVAARARTGSMSTVWPFPAVESTLVISGSRARPAFASAASSRMIRSSSSTRTWASRRTA